MQRFDRIYELVLRIIAENQGASAHVLADKITRSLIIRENRVRIELNKDVFEEEMARAQHILRCKHYEGKKQVPCPPTCPRQSWPTWKFHRTIFGNLKLNKGLGE